MWSTKSQSIVRDRASGFKEQLGVPMPPKRAGSSAPATPSKRNKGQNQQQQSLNSFFASPRGTKARNDIKEEAATSVAESSTLSGQEEDEDALFALKLAAREAGVSLTEMRRRLAGPGSRKSDVESAATQCGAPATDLPVHPLFNRSKVNADTVENGHNRPKTPSPDLDSNVPGPSTPRKVTFDFQAMDRDIEQVDFTQDVLEFEPASVKTSNWPRLAGNADKPVTPYALLSHAFIAISATRARLLITTVLTNLMRTIKFHDPESIISAVYLITNHIAPNYDDVQLGIGGSITSKAIKSVTGKSAKTMKTLWDQTGDPGDVAYEAKKDIHPLIKPPPITVPKLFTTLHTIASLTHSGAGSTNAKLNHVTKLLVASRGEEARWLVRTFHAHLRIGAVKKTLSSAIARAFSLIEEGENQDPNEFQVGHAERQGILANPTKPKERQNPRRLLVMSKFIKAEKLVREVLARHPNFTSLLEALSGRGEATASMQQHGLPHLSSLVPLRIGVPLSPMLGSITRSLSDVYTKLGVGTPSARAFVSEFKYDGQRVQIHATKIPDAALGADGKLSDAARKKRKDVDERGRGKWIGEAQDIYVRLFSRHLEDMTSKYPDILDLIPLLMSRPNHDPGTTQRIDSFIMDAEVVAIGAHEGELLPFQTLSNRSRKDVNIKEVKVKVGVFAFDLMYLDGISLLKSSFRSRRRQLHARFPPLAPENPLVARFAHVKSSESNEPDEVERFFEEARNSKCEGIMIKTLDHHWQRPPAKVGDHSESSKVSDGDQKQDVEDGLELEQLGEIVSEDLTMEEDDAEVAKKGNGGKSKGDDQDDSDVIGKGVSGRGKALLSTYEPDKRCESWLKVKRDYVDGIGDSLDLVPIGAWHGMGRKAKWWSPILLAVYDADEDTYQAVCKCISGFTDAEYKRITFEAFPEVNEPDTSCWSSRYRNPDAEYSTGGYTPDVWFKPTEVWEVRGADITLSPVYPAAKGLVSQERGLSMRFPRFLKRRLDKGPEQASGPRQLAQIYFSQNAASAQVAEDDPLGDPVLEDEEQDGFGCDDFGIADAGD
ncbi:unnamed protein product [Sympodiomycopsis kandeliae]